MPEQPRPDISDAAHEGKAGFYFLPPLVRAPALSGITDGSLSPTVLVCEWDVEQSRCVTTVAGFSRNVGTASETIRYDATAEHYVVNWHTDRCISGDCSLDPAKAYRLSVYVGAVELGYADVKPVTNASQLRNVQTDEYVGLVNGRTLPVKFRIEEAALAVLQHGASAMVGAAGGSITTATGDASLEIPAGALNGDVVVTITPASSYPDGPGEWSQPMEFGPTGTTFDTPVTLSLSFDPEKVPEAVALDDLAIYHFDGTGWVFVEGSTVNDDLGVVSAPIEHFSIYSIMIRPNTITGTATPTTIAIGDTIFVSGYAQGYRTETGRICKKILFFKVSCKTYTNVQFYPSYSAVYWNTNGVVVVTTHRTYPDANGNFSSPPIVGRLRGVGQLVAWTQECVAILGCERATHSNLLEFNVWERLTQIVFSPPMPPMGLGQIVTHTISIPTKRSIPVSLLVTNSDSAVTVRAGSSSAAGLETIVVTLEPGITSVPISYVANELGTSTITVSSSDEYFGTVAIVLEVLPGRVLLEGMPALLQLGDTAEVILRVLRPDGIPAAAPLAQALSFSLTTRGRVTFAGGTTTRDVRPGSSGSSAFRIIAGAVGTDTLTISGDDYEAAAYVVSVEPTQAEASVFRSRTAWAAEAGSGWPTIDFSTRDNGDHITNPSTDAFFPSLTLRGVEFVNVQSYWNGSVYVAQNQPLRVNLPAGTVAFGADLTDFYDVAGTYTITLSTGDVFTIEGLGLPWVWEFFGVVSATPIQWVEFKYNNTFLMLDNFSFKTLTDAGKKFAAISAGQNSTCATTVAGKLYCWGGWVVDGFSGSLVPHAMAGEQIFTSVSMSTFHASMLAQNGHAYSWGDGGSGRFGNGAAFNSHTPVPAVGGHSFVDLTAGYQHGCGVRTDGQAYCWGNGFHGQLGNGMSGTNIQLEPTPVLGGLTFKSISSSIGAVHTCALTQAGQAYCWGENGGGQIGDGSNAWRNTPTAVSGGHVFVSLSTGGGTSCGITAAGQAYCWGYNGVGQLGDGSTTHRKTPVVPAGTLTLAAISVGYNHTCALTPGGQAYCWGSNDDGRLGNGSTVSSALPVLVSGGKKFTSISAGTTHTCALTPEGEAYCWGSGVLGRLGNGLETSSSVPVLVSRIP